MARLQRTIDEKQRRWETYARHAPGRGISTLSDGSTEHLHHTHTGGSGHGGWCCEGRGKKGPCMIFFVCLLLRYVIFERAIMVNLLVNVFITNL